MQRSLCPVLIGREDELSELEDALLAANRGDGQVVVLAGDAGMGKTRLATELQQRARQLGMHVLWGGCSEADLALPYLPFLEAIGNYLAGTDVEELRARLGPVRRELAHLFPQLEPEGVAPDVDSTQGRLRLYEAVLALLSLAARDHGLLLLIEDLHWADASTRELLDYLTRRLRNARIMVLATYRSDEMHRKHPLLPLIQGWKRASTATVVQLEPLTPATVAEMVVAIFDLKDGVADDTRDFLHTRTEGNPFVLEEMLKASLDRGDIFRNEEGWTRKALADFKLPESVRDTILLRLDRLQSGEVDTLRAAAVLGGSFSYESLIAVSGRSEAEVRSAVETCVLQQFLADDPRRPRGGYRFRHALTREAIYDDIISPVKESLHALAADSLRAAGGTPLEISQHLLAAGREPEAVPLCLEAAAKAESEYAHADAAALYERVLPYLKEDDRRRAEILCRLGAAYWGAGRSSTAYGFLETGIGLAEHLGDLYDVAHYRLILGRCAWEMNRTGEALKAFEQARSDLEPAGPSNDLAMAYVRLALLRIADLDPEGATKLARTAIEIAERAGSDGAKVEGMNYLAGGLMGSGWVEEAVSTYHHAFKEAMRLRLYSPALIVLNNLTIGRCVEYLAADALDELDLLGEIPASPVKSLIASHIEGNAAYYAGDLERSARAFEREIEVSREIGQARGLVRGRKGLADCLRGMDRDAEARAVELRPEELSEAVEDRSWVTRDLIRDRLAKGEIDSLDSLGQLIFEADPQGHAANRSDLGQWCMWAFIASGNLESARRAAEMGIGNGANVPLPTRSLLDAGLAILDGDIEKAIEHLRETVRLLDAARYHLDACPARRRLADLMLQLDDVAGAVTELRHVIAVAGPLGMSLERRLAAEALEKLGVVVADDRPSPSTDTGPAGERYVSVLFLDVRGYTALARAKPPAELSDLVRTLQRWAAAEVAKQHGVIDKFAGDAIMATFNISGAHVDHAQHALSSALAIRDKAAALGLPIGAGIATGPAVVGALTDRANVSVLGEATNLASRLQAKAGPGEVLLSAEAHRRVGDWLSSRSITAEKDQLALKGFDDAIEAWRIRGPGREPAG